MKYNHPWHTRGRKPLRLPKKVIQGPQVIEITQEGKPGMYYITTIWDPEARVWVATSDDVPGLVTEAETAEELEVKLQVMIPELLENNCIGGKQDNA